MIRCLLLIEFVELIDGKNWVEFYGCKVLQIRTVHT